MRHTPASAADSIATLRQLRAEAGRQDLPFNVTLQAPWPCEPDIVDEFASAGVDRLVCYPWEGAGEHWPWNDLLDGFEIHLVAKGAARQVAIGRSQDTDRWAVGDKATAGRHFLARSPRGRYHPRG